MIAVPIGLRVQRFATAAVPAYLDWRGRPEPEGLADATIASDAARFDRNMGKWLLDYVAVRDAADPDEMLLSFLQSGYEAIA